MAKKSTLWAMLTGAALAGGVMYLKKLSEQQQAAAEGVDADLNDIPEAESEEAPEWRATYTIDGEELTSDEVKERFKEEAGKAMSNFKADAKVISEELLVGLKKAITEMKAAVEEAKKAAAERRAAEPEADACECAEKAAECCCEKAEEVKEDLEKAAECCCEKAKEAAEDVKEAVENVVEEIKDAVKD